MQIASGSDLSFIDRHRQVWEARPELRYVYNGMFSTLLGCIGKRSPVVEFGTGPGFFKEFHPSLLTTDVIPTRWVDVVCDGCATPFKDGSIGAVVMLDVLHHLPHPINFVKEASRVLAPGGIVAMIEPWITPASYLLYRYFHHEDCKLNIDIASPFGSTGKAAFDGNATIPYKLVQHYSRSTSGPLRIAKVEPFLALPYLATLGFKRTKPLPASLIQASAKAETMLGPMGRWNATRALIVWEKLLD